MLLQSAFDLTFHLPSPAVIVAVLNLHPSMQAQLRAGDQLLIEHLGTSNYAGVDPRVVLPSTSYTDTFGNVCTRFLAPAGHLRLSGSCLIEVDGEPEKSYPDAQQTAIEDLPSEVFQFLLPSRYCEVDRFGGIANDLFGATKPGWERVTAIRDWVHEKVIFDYNAARPTKTAMDVFTERIGVCRDFQHLAVTLSRCLNIPARYVTGYIGDIRTRSTGPGDFSAWYQVFLDGHWIDLDARHNSPRLGRLLMATGRDAADVALTTSFGTATLTSFYVDSWEIDAAGNRVLLRGAGRPLDLDTPDPTPSSRDTPVSANMPTQTNANYASPVQTQAATT
jgi:transglutaminase-like putative cysteine protease